MDGTADLSEQKVASRLATRIRQGDQTAEEEFVQRYSRGLMLYLRTFCRDHALAEDLHQEAFGVVLVRLRDTGLDEPARLGAFLRRTARNLFIGDYRKKARRRTDDGVERLHRLATVPPNQHRRLEREQQAQWVRELLHELNTPRDREILFRFYIAEEDKQDICRDLDLDGLHFNRVLFRARQRLKEIMRRTPLHN
ncbi:MAG TPA: sigma-70 family RNA polymerase sigma factor [Acidobacteriota bacterium]|nr:sigma-70 family RNA polymerase sigma factor [Acidobacteriota bacterium]